jgi:hypothetical protein
MHLFALAALLQGEHSAQGGHLAQGEHSAHVQNEAELKQVEAELN